MDNTDEDLSYRLPSEPLHGQGRQTSEQGSLVDSEDDLFLGTDAQAYSASRQPLHSVTSSDSASTGPHYEASNESSGVSRHDRVIKKLAHVGRLASSESLISYCSDFSRSSHDVISLLNAMTVDPEEFLADLGFAEPDMRSRIPDRFLESPSSAHGIDVDFFRRSLDQDDYFGSPSQESSVWSDPGSSRIPLRFIASGTQPVNPEPSGSYTSVPLISEPEDAPEDSFDLMRHLRLNKPCHVTKGMFLEPVTEEVEVSSVGSGTVRTKISRKLSNEEGTIVREESFESELLLHVPGVDNADKSPESNEFTETTAPEKKDESLIVVTVEHEENAGALLDKNAFTGDSAKSSDSDAVNFGDDGTDVHQRETIICELNENHVSVDHVTKEYEEIPLALPSLAHLRVASVVVQDSFELEEVTSEELNEKESSFTDPEAGLNVKSPEKRLTRENSGESSGFEEMLPDKDTLSPSSYSPTLSAKRFPADAHAIVSDSRTPLAALLDPEMLSIAAEKARVSDHCEDEKSPRAIFAQRRSKSLTKQRPVDEDILASYVYGPSVALPKDLADDRSLGVKLNRDASSKDLGPILHAMSTTIISNIDVSNSSRDFLSVTDENYNTLLKTEPEVSVLEGSDVELGETGTVADERLGGQLRSRRDLLSAEEDQFVAVSQSGFGSSEVAIISEESRLRSSLVTDNNTSEQNSQSTVYAHLKTDDSHSTNDGENSLGRPETGEQFEQESGKSPDNHVASENHIVSPAPGELTEEAGACAQVKEEESQKPLRKFESDYQQHYLHEINVLEQSIQKYESTLSSDGPLDALRSIYSTKHMLARITEEMNAIQELRLLINSELERMKHLLDERRNMLMAGAARDPVGSGVSQKMADLLREQTSLNMGLSNISDELSIRRKASRRARIHSHIESAKRELKEEREKCIREFREEIKEALVRELSEKFCSEVDSLRQEVRRKDALIEQLKKSEDQREPGD